MNIYKALMYFPTNESSHQKLEKLSHTMITPNHTWEQVSINDVL